MPSLAPATPAPPITASPVGTAEATVTPPPGTVPPATPSAGPSVPPSLPVDPSAWVGPDLISERHYLMPSLAVDQDGHAHVAATLGHDIYYVTNSTGSWTRERISNAATDLRHIGPVIALDRDGSLGIAFTETCRACAGGVPDDILFSSGSSGSWSTPSRIAGGWAAALELVDGVVHLAYNDGNVEDLEDLNDQSRPLYGTNAGGSWASVPLANLGAISAMDVTVGSIQVVFSTWDHGQSDRNQLRMVSTAGISQPFADDDVPIAVGDNYYAVTFDADGRPHVVWSSSYYDGDVYRSSTARHLWRAANGWVNDELDEATQPSAIAVHDETRLHAVEEAWGLAETPDVVYWQHAGDGDEFKKLGCCVFENNSGDWATPTIAVDSLNRPHIFYGTAEGSWYAVGPDD